jgi:hypothetical protein
MTSEDHRSWRSNLLVGVRVLFLRGLLSLALVFALAKGASAQTVQLDFAQITRTQTESTLPTQNVPPSGVSDDQIVASPNDADLGEQQILKRAESYQAFTASVGAPFYWTSNVALSRTGEQNDFLIAPSAALSYTPRITKTLYGFVGVREQLFYYDRFPDLDFGSFDVEAGLFYTVPQLHNLTLRAEYDYNRLTDEASFDDFFSNHSLIFSADLPFHLSRSQQLSLGVDTNISLTADPEPPRRHDFGAYVGYSVQLSRSFSISASGRVVLRDYQQTDRLDVSEILSVSANYSVTKWLSASAISSLAANQSNHSVFDYKVANGGGAVSLSIKF